MPARTFLSLLLIKVREQVEWSRAAQLLEMDYVDPRQRAAGYVYRARVNGVRDHLRHRVDLLSELLDASYRRVNYADRRRRFADFDGITDSGGDAITAACGIRPGKGARRVNCDIWAWAELTGGPLFQAPAARRAGYRPSGRRVQAQARPKNFWSNYSRFYVQDLPKLREALTAYAADLVAGEPLRPVREHELQGLLAASATG